VTDEAPAKCRGLLSRPISQTRRVFVSSNYGRLRG